MVTCLLRRPAEAFRLEKNHGSSAPPRSVTFAAQTAGQGIDAGPRPGYRLSFPWKRDSTHSSPYSQRHPHTFPFPITLSWQRRGNFMECHSCASGNPGVAPGRARAPTSKLFCFDPDDFFLHSGYPAIEGGMNRGAKGRFAVLLRDLAHQLAFSDPVAGLNHRPAGGSDMLF